MNYADEHADLGVSEALEKTVYGTGGNMYGPEELDKIVKEVKSKQTHRDKKSVLPLAVCDRLHGHTP